MNLSPIVLEQTCNLYKIIIRYLKKNIQSLAYHSKRLYHHCNNQDNSSEIVGNFHLKWRDKIWGLKRGLKIRTFGKFGFHNDAIISFTDSPYTSDIFNQSSRSCMQMHYQVFQIILNHSNKIYSII